jgi:hypothetical protein
MMPCAIDSFSKAEQGIHLTLNNLILGNDIL